MSASWWSKLLSFKRAKPEYAVIAKNANVREADKVIITQLTKIGAHMDKPREVLHYLYLPSQEAAKHSARVLRAEGYEAEVRLAANAASEPENPWMVIATIHSVVNDETVERMRQRFERLAIDHNGDYDGWEAAAVP